jgi:hypothetical protein
VADWEGDRKKVYDHLCKDKTYPCQYCSREVRQEECSDKACEKWKSWFRRTWRKIQTAGREVQERLQEDRHG